MWPYPKPNALVPVKGLKTSNIDQSFSFYRSGCCDQRHPYLEDGFAGIHNLNEEHVNVEMPVA
jgi:hypothetical protein